MSYNPSKPIASGSRFASNPLFVNYDRADTGWRPQAMVAGPDGNIYIGSVAGYGSVNGPLTIWNPRTNKVRKVAGVVPGESVVTLARAGKLIVGGTSIYGGGGSRPTQKEARLFIWDPATGRKTFEAAPIAAATRMTDFLAISYDKIMGIASGSGLDIKERSMPLEGAKLFVFDLKTHRTV